MISAACNYLLEKDFSRNEKIVNETIAADNWGELQFGQSIGKDNFLGDIERSSSFEMDSRPDNSDHRNTEKIEILESNSPLFMRDRSNSYDESPDNYKEGQDHFKDLEPVNHRKQK